MPKSPQIPFCKSEFLQDFAISLGCRLPKADNGWRSFHSEVGFHECEGESLERLCVWITTFYGTETSLNLWEDKTIWIQIAILPRNPENFKIGFYPDFALLGIDRLVEALIESVSVSTRLCYDESPEPLLRQIWSFNGEVEIEGVI